MINSSPAEKPDITFRTAFNGYSKEDVNKYIEEINLKFTETESEYKKIMLSQKKQIDELTGHLDEARTGLNELPVLREQNRSIAAELEKTGAELGDMQKKNSENVGLIESLNEKLGKLTAEYDLLSQNANKAAAEENAPAEAAAQVSAEKAGTNGSLLYFAENTADKRAENETKNLLKQADPSDSEKARMFDKISRQIGSMLIDAREIADSIINDANIQAERTALSAENRAKEICGDADVKLNHAMNFIKNTMKRMSSDFMSEYLEHINNTRSALEKLLGDTSADADSVYSKFDVIIKSTLQDINKGIDKIITVSEPKSTGSENEPESAGLSPFTE